jgi:hypothetical protein
MLIRREGARPQIFHHGCKKCAYPLIHPYKKCKIQADIPYKKWIRRSLLPGFPDS